MPGRYADTMYISTTESCIAQWTETLEGADDCEFDVHGCPMYFRMSEGEVIYVGDRSPPSSVVVHWVHPTPLPGLKYQKRALND